MVLRAVLIGGAMIAVLSDPSLAEEPFRRRTASESARESAAEASSGSPEAEQRVEKSDQAPEGGLSVIEDPQGLGRSSIDDAAPDPEEQEEWMECAARPEVQAYLRRVSKRVLNRWALSSDLDPNLSVTLLFALDTGGAANRLEYVSADDEALAAGGIRAARAAAPFGKMSERARCLAGTPVQITFRNLAARFRGGTEVSYARGESVIDRMREAFEIVE